MNKDFEIVRLYKELRVAIKNGKYGIVSKEGEVLIDFEYISIIPSMSSDLFVLIDDNGRASIVKYDDLVASDELSI